MGFSYCMGKRICGAVFYHLHIMLHLVLLTPQGPGKDFDLHRVVERRVHLCMFWLTLSL